MNSSIDNTTSLDYLLQEELSRIQDQADAILDQERVFEKELKDKFDYCFACSKTFDENIRKNNVEIAWLNFVKVALILEDDPIYDETVVDAEFRSKAGTLHEHVKKMISQEGNVMEKLKKKLQTNLSGSHILVRVKEKASQESSNIDTFSSSNSLNLTVGSVKSDLKKIYEENEVKEVKIYGDGHCLFRAISQGLELEKKLGISETASIKLLRKKVAAAYRAMRDREMLPMVTYEDGVLLEGKAKTYEEYVTSIEGNAYGGATELLILSKLLKAQLAVYEEQGLQYRQVDVYGTGSHKVMLLWKKGKKSEKGNHYNLLRRRRTKTPEI